MREEIEPKLDKLRAEKRSYLEYQKATSELERLTRLVKAYEWKVVGDKVEKAGALLEERMRDIDTAKADVERGGGECKDMEKELEEIEARRAKVSFPATALLTKGNGKGWQAAGPFGRSERAGT